MGSVEDAKKKQKRKEIPYRDPDSSSYAIAVGRTITAKGMAKIRIESDNEFDDARPTQFINHHIPGEFAVSTASSKGNLFVFDPRHNEKTVAKLMTQDSKKNIKVIEIYVGAAPFLAAHGFAGEVGEELPRVMEMAKVRV
ncbi:hypothetical protein TrRE_jg11241 [Triparma retinervis]|uniref:Uncharacterized protein n=1 Tax=Triparma retinervis TaxID=2557542 RepID=A0A9W7A870_9STRA|nr:hypothetical protein TrRE_jg11241 [Triparma retinervis]